ncbi:MAG: hypothetical protein ABR611_00720 [Chthoniobacterales bacterium]
MPGQRRGRRGCTIAIAVTHPDAETRTAAQAHWSGEAAPERVAVAFAFGKTVEVAQAETHPIGIARCFPRFFSLSIPKIFAKEKPAAVET